ncbi:hypothetical protein [uncultured Campylobacter sp.]|uniref:hypothetical protein n=1 Tax=uncultured Campylobacter sp. TaxID=218934 RepID=UPI00261393F8|nr:hypothetical protein [uncultured Campylobacter sp.]
MQEIAPPQEKWMRPSDDCPPHSLAAALKVIVHLLAKFYNFNRVAFYHATRIGKIKSTEMF